MFRLRISEYSKLSYIINYERLLRLIYIFMKAIIKSNVALFKSVISMKDYENGNNSMFVRWTLGFEMDSQCCIGTRSE